MPKKVSKNQLDKKEAAERIQRFYRNYLKNKQTDTAKNQLFPNEPGEAERNQIPASTNSEKEKQALFFHANKSSILFKKSGWATLFPIDNNQQTKINFSLLEHYLNKGIDIRPFTLEAYLHDRIDKHTLISLFQLQQFVHEFWGEPGSVKKAQPIKLFSVHNSGELTKSAQEKLIPYLIQSAPPITKQSNEKFIESLQLNLQALPPTGNIFAIMEIPEEVIYRIAYYLLDFVDIKKGSVKQDIFNNELKNAKGFFKLLAEQLKVQLNVEDKLAFTQLKYSFMDELEKKIIADLKKENKKIERKNLAAYMDDNITLFDVLIRTSLATTGEFIPTIEKVRGNKLKGTLLGIGSDIQDIWLKSVTGKSPESILTKVPTLGSVSVESLDQMTYRKERPIGLTYEGIVIPEEVHDAVNKPYGYLAHDSRFHYPALFYLIAYSEPSYQIQLMFVDAIRQATGQSVNKTIINILDFANAYYYDSYTGIESAKTQIEAMFFIPEEESDAKAATLEYAFIVVCDILKNPDAYMTQLKLISNQYASADPDYLKPNFLIQQLLDDFAVVDFNQKINPYLNKLSTYSPSLNVFLCLLIHENKYDMEEINSLCDKLHLLEQEKLLTFKWNKKDGLMLNVDSDSFRFRASGDDYRKNITYPNDGLTRMVSTEPNWWAYLNDRADEKIKSLHSRASTFQRT